jgi:hypothetical protein
MCKSQVVPAYQGVSGAIRAKPVRWRKAAYWFPVRGSEVLRVNEFQLYELAVHIHPLTTVDREAKYSEVWFAWFQAKEALQNLFKLRSLEVCFAIANELYAALGNIVPQRFEDALAKVPADQSAEEPLGWEVQNIKTAAEKFETVIAAELSNSDTYWISPKGTHKTSTLLQFAHLELPPSVIKEIPEVKADFDEAGKCLLFDTSTAVAFHLMRATEVVIRKYYKAVTGVEPKDKFRNWGAYIKRLRERGANPKITGFLDHIRENYRNPILHPTVTLSAEEAQILFGICVSAIVMMASEMKSVGGPSLPFPATGALTAGNP